MSLVPAVLNHSPLAAWAQRASTRSRPNCSTLYSIAFEVAALRGLMRIVQSRPPGLSWRPRSCAAAGERSRSSCSGATPASRSISPASRSGPYRSKIILLGICGSSGTSRKRPSRSPPGWTSVYRELRDSERSASRATTPIPHACAGLFFAPRHCQVRALLVVRGAEAVALTLTAIFQSSPISTFNSPKTFSTLMMKFPRSPSTSLTSVCGSTPSYHRLPSSSPSPPRAPPGSRLSVSPFRDLPARPRS